LWLDLITLLYSLTKLDFRHGAAIGRADVWLLIYFPFLMINRRQVQRLRRTPDRIILKRLFPKSIVWQYFILKRRAWDQLQALKLNK
ncbi:MAG: hypothetical protein V2A61_00965, partial [Calditrichota bacterium]